MVESAADDSSLFDSLLGQTPLAVRFAWLSTVGQGRAGAVFKVRDRERNGEIVALKILADRGAFDENTVVRFMQEIKACREIRHPNLVRAHDLVRAGQVLGYTMEFVEGIDLLELIKRRRLSYREIDRIFVQILNGVESLHQHHIVHRDLKLENVLIRGDGCVKVSDLGLLKNLNSPRLTSGNMLLGTPQYMPPEYVRGGQYDQRGDLYAVGLMLYEVLGHRRRFNDLNGAQVMDRLIKSNFAVEPLVVLGLPDKYHRLLARAFKVKPAWRFQSAREMRRALISGRVSKGGREMLRRLLPIGLAALLAAAAAGLMFLV